MEQLEFINGRLLPRDNTAFIRRLFVAALAGLTPDEFADQELEIMRQKYEAEGDIEAAAPPGDNPDAAIGE